MTSTSRVHGWSKPTKASSLSEISKSGYRRPDQDPDREEQKASRSVEKIAK
jgi:hypothetical protein